MLRWRSRNPSGCCTRLLSPKASSGSGCCMIDDDQPCSSSSSHPVLLPLPSRYKSPVLRASSLFPDSSSSSSACSVCSASSRDGLVDGSLAATVTVAPSVLVLASTAVAAAGVGEWTEHHQVWPFFSCRPTPHPRFL